MSMRKVKFAVMADLHLDVMHDGLRRIRAFLGAAEDESVDFVIQLGDFTYPNDTSQTLCSYDEMPPDVRNAYENPSNLDKEGILREYNRFRLPTYHTMGDRDFVFTSPEGACQMYGIPRGYYSFHVNGWHFIVLDTNYWKDEAGKDVHYGRGEYFSKDRPYLAHEELEWLRSELRRCYEPTVIFSHHPLFEYERCIKNYSEFQEVIEEAKSRGKKIRMCLSAHNHADAIADVDKTVYFQLNSISMHWVGKEYQCKRYSGVFDDKFPSLRYTVPYRTPIWAIVTLSEDGCVISGKKGRFVLPGPKEIGYPEKLTPHVSSFEKKWDL